MLRAMGIGVSDPEYVNASVRMSSGAQNQGQTLAIMRGTYSGGDLVVTVMNKRKHSN